MRPGGGNLHILCRWALSALKVGIPIFKCFDDIITQAGRREKGARRGGKAPRFRRIYKSFPKIRQNNREINTFLLKKIKIFCKLKN